MPRKTYELWMFPNSPKPEPGWVKAKVAWCGICGSDLHEYLAGPIFIPTAEHPLTHRKSPLILGHEFSGEIAELGDGVQGYKVGDRVAPDACQHCGECYFCKREEYHMCVKLAFTWSTTRNRTSRSSCPRTNQAYVRARAISGRRLSVCRRYLAED